MELKDKIDLVSKRVDIINKKITILLVIASGIWLYGVKSGTDSLFMVAVLVFLVVVYFLFTNFLTLNDLDKKLKDLLDA